MLDRQKEKSLKDNGDFHGLLELHLSDSGGLGGLADKSCKMYYYSGRLHSEIFLSSFLQKFGSLISFHVDIAYKDLFELLYKVGTHFPELTDQEFELLEKYYQNPKYFDLFEDILFDQNLLKRKLKKYDASIRETTNSNFSANFLNDVFKAAMFNHEAEDENIYFYDKSKNTVEKKYFDGDDIIRGVHYQVQFLNNFKDLANAIDSVLGSEIRQSYFNKHSNDIMRDTPYNMILNCGFSPYYFDLFKKFVAENGDKFNLPSNPIDKLIQHISLAWLNKVNQV